MNLLQLREQIVRPALEKIELYSPEAEELLLGTACVESECGEFVRQYPAGPALGIFQMEMATYNDIVKNYLDKRPNLKAKVMAIYCEGLSPAENLISNLMFAAVMCRIHYLRQPANIPTTLEGRAAYWKKYYNTKLGKGTAQKFIDKYKRFCS